MPESVPEGGSADGRLGRAAAWAFAGGLVLVAAAGVTLWAQVGTEVFLAQAFSALAACF